MAATGDPLNGDDSAIVCPSCGEWYDGEERIAEVLFDSGFCANLTCLQDLTAAPPAALRPGTRPSPAPRDGTVH